MHEFISFALFVITLTLVISIFRRFTKDACLKEFIGYTTTLLFHDGRIRSGKLRVEQSGIELEKERAKGSPTSTSSSSPNPDLIDWSTTILFAHEFSIVDAFVRFHDELSPKEGKRRLASLKGIYFPTFAARMKRRMVIMFKLARDGFLDIIDLIIGAVKSYGPVQKFVPKGEKQSGQLKQELGSFITTAYDPLLERHIGNYVYIEMSEPLASFPKTEGVLKNYTAKFVELMDVSLVVGEDGVVRMADIILPRQGCTIRRARRRA